MMQSSNMCRMYVQIMVRAKFTYERMAAAKQRAGHLRSLHFNDEAAKADRAAAQHESSWRVSTECLALASQPNPVL